MPLSIQAALLGIVQGLTEFLPVSSSAHLIIARAFFGYDHEQFGLPFDVAVHVGTAMAVLAYFHADITQMIAALPRVWSTWFGPRVPENERDDYAWLVGLLIVGTIPIAVIGGTFASSIEGYLRSPVVAAIALAAGAGAFILAERLGSRARHDRSLTPLEVFWIGCAQALALIPGISRSGATMTVALLFGIRRADAARFVFLLGLPAILAAAVLEMPALIQEGSGSEGLSLLLIGAGTSAITGYLAIRFFIRYVGKHSLHVFAWYRLAVAASVAIWLLF